jgi:hypothetical protein
VASIKPRDTPGPGQDITVWRSQQYEVTVMVSDVLSKMRAARTGGTGDQKTTINVFVIGN